MRSGKRSLGLSGLIAALAAMAVAAPAATGNVNGSCVLQGQVKTNPAVPLVGGSGSYNANLTLVCNIVENANNPAVVETSVASEGIYNNLACGTGSATSINNTVSSWSVLAGSPAIDVNAYVAGLDYTLEFVAGQGTLTWESHEELGGAVTLQADSVLKGSPGPPDCVKAMQVEGAVTLPTARLCHGKPITDAGTDNMDGINTGAGSQVIHGFGEDDILASGGDDDDICSGSGDDLSSGGAGGDVITGASGNDVIKGGSGRDVLSGGRGSDEIYDGPDADEVLAADNEPDTIWPCDDGILDESTWKIDPLLDTVKPPSSTACI